MTPSTSKVILGSRSPRRLELLGHLVPRERIEVVPPASADEAGFSGIDGWPDLERRLTEIADAKCDDVLDQVASQADDDSEIAAVITADTIIVATAADGRPVVLGQPPTDESYAETVRGWFQDFYSGRTHTAATGMCVAVPGGQKMRRLVRSEVTFRDDVDRWIDWYLATGEPRGKAGGYALQGAGGLFVANVAGSISNVVGLPLRELLDVFEELQIDAG